MNDAFEVDGSQHYFNRRKTLRWIGAAALTASTQPLWAQSAPNLENGTAALGNEVIRLWPGSPPGSMPKRPHLKIVEHSTDIARPDRTITGVADPALIVFRPQRPNGAAMLVIPGGGYEFEAFDNEGTRQAAWLNRHGITAFVLAYRLPGEGWARRSLVPLQDAQRAMRVIRSSPDRYRIDPERVGVLGFSAGGHLAGSLLTRSNEAVYAAVDRADMLSATPALAGLLYPVITMHPDFTHAGSRRALLGDSASHAEEAAASVDERVTDATPPAFIVQTNDDPIVPVENAVKMYEAMRRFKRPVALHLFEQGGHGFGVNHQASEPVSAWPDLFSPLRGRPRCCDRGEPACRQTRLCRERAGAKSA